jgi:beta-aspartyl-peptidase (threonine type)
MPVKPAKKRRVAAVRTQRAPERAPRTWALVIHGGASAAHDQPLGPARERAIRAALSEVLQAGARALAAGVGSLDVVEEAVRDLEDSPLFNAGKGAVFNSRGEHELEASIMDGRTLQAGAVASVRGIQNPIVLARWVMERSRHVYLHGEGAAAFAVAQGMELVAPDYFWTEESWNALKAARLHTGVERPPPREVGTVGTVALDRHGNLAAATSTGGLTNKPPGRVGDSSVIGAGTYASNESCAVSCTGEGEYFIRAGVARDICARVEYTGNDPASAAAAVLERLGALGGQGGVIVVDRDGRVACVFNTDSMYRGAVSHDTAVQVAVRAHESP